MVEEQCVAQARGGDASAFEELVRTYEAPVYRLALRMCGGRAEDAQEVAQEAFLAAWRGLPRFRGQCRFSSWLYKLTANAAVDHLRREKRRPAAVPLENAGEPADPHTPQEELERRELHRAVQQALDRLTPEHREVLVLREIQQLSYDEIADTLSLDLGTVKSRINRGRRQLRDFLIKQGNFSAPAASKKTERGL